MGAYILNDAKMFSDISDGVAIVINSETGIYYGMNGFGSAVFACFLDGRSTEEIAAAIKTLPGAPADFEAHLQKFVEKLVKCEILLEGSTSGGSVVLDGDVAHQDAFVLTVQEFSDAQELLLADPIHEVKEDTGWQPAKDALETDQSVVQTKESKMRH